MEPPMTCDIGDAASERVPVESRPMPARVEPNSA